MTKDWPTRHHSLTVGGARAAGGGELADWASGAGRLLSAGEMAAAEPARRPPGPGGRLRGPGRAGAGASDTADPAAARPGTARLDMAMARSSRVGRRHGPGLPGRLLRPAAPGAAHGGPGKTRTPGLPRNRPGSPRHSQHGHWPSASGPGPCTSSFLELPDPSWAPPGPFQVPSSPTQRPSREPPPGP